MRKRLKANAIGWIGILLVTGFLFGCSEEEPFEPIDPIDPDVTNHLPVIASRSDTFAIVGDTLRLEFSATDQDGDSLHFEREIYCTWGEIRDGQCHPPISHIDSRTGRFWFYPRTSDIPVREVTVTVYDARGGYASTTFSIYVSMGP